MGTHADQSRFTALDALRFFASIAVVVYHLFAPSMIEPDAASVGAVLQIVSQYGYLGVNLFFVISGFVILASAQNKSASQFAISRFARLYPTYWASLVITSFVVITIGNESPKFGLREWLGNATMFNNYMDIRSIDGVYWTLHVEIKFYALVFLLCLARWINHVRVWVPVWLIAVVVANFTNYFPYLGWFISPTYSAYFISGVCFYLLATGQHQRFAGLVLAISASLCTWQAAEQVDDFYRNAGDFGPYIAMSIVVGIHAVFLAIAMGRFRLRQSRLLLILGGLTYPLYLLHNVAGKAMIAMLLKFGLPFSVSIAVVIAGTLSVSYLLFRFVDGMLAKQIKDFLTRQCARIGLRTYGDKGRA